MLSSSSSTDIAKSRRQSPHPRFAAELGAVQHNQPTNRRGATGVLDLWNNRAVLKQMLSSSSK
eukprot:1183972-Prorocentrum_minimum.AAC.3